MTDPVCGMEVDTSTALRVEHGSEMFYFCSERCRKTFLARLATRAVRPQHDVLRSILNALGSFASSSATPKTAVLFGLLLVLMLTINGLNVLNSYVGRDFVSAIERKEMPAFMRQSGFYLLVLAASTAVAVLYRFAEERLALLLRDSQTRWWLGRYLANGLYLRLATSGDVENPDQRISEDIRTFTTTTLSFVLMTLNALFTVVAFSGVLWSIRPLLFGVAVAYALIGSCVTYLVGRQLVGLTDAQFDREADFRAELIGLRANAESIAIAGCEDRINERLLRKLDGVVENARHVVAVGRNVNFFVTLYNYLVPILPVFVVAHLFMSDRVPFGVVTQSAMAFAQLMGAFSLIVTQFQSISSYAAVIARLERLSDAMEAAADTRQSTIRITDTDGELAYDGLTLRAADGQVLIAQLTVAIARGTRVAIVAANAHARGAILRATAGLWTSGEGRIRRPDVGSLSFLTEHPYLPKGTLRELLVQPGLDRGATDAQIHSTLHALGIAGVIERAGGPDMEQDWNELLSSDERFFVALARALMKQPHLVLVDGLHVFGRTAAATRALDLLSERRIGVLALGRPEDDVTRFQHVLRIATDGTCEDKT